jgi:hypothetical protein
MIEVVEEVALVSQEARVKPLAEEDDLIQRFLDDIEERGLEGEKDNAATVFLCATSARLKRPLNLTVNGESSSGKNYLLSSAMAFIPDEFKKEITGLSPKALMHAKEDEFQHKAVVIAEYEGVSKADYAIRTMQSEQVIEWHFVDTGKGIQKKLNRVKGPVAFLQATTRPVLHPENETRLLFISVDESPEQTYAILKRQAQAAVDGVAPASREASVAAWHEFLRSLEPMVVSIPYAPALVDYFPRDKVRCRRDFPKLLALIESSAFLHQHKREKAEDKVLANSSDYAMAKQLFANCYKTGPDSKLAELLEAAESIKGDFRVSDMMAKTGWGQSKTYAVAERAKELGCIAETETRGVYRFVRSSAVPPLELPEAI